MRRQALLGIGNKEHNLLQDVPCFRIARDDDDDN